jgi:DNA (cytosine-5)-methyltransferase 1
MKSVFKFIDLFSGIGGFRLALNNLGGECLGYSEIDKNAIASYCENFEEAQDSNFGDITKITSLPEHDLLTGGVPCQSWSIAGKNLGFDDDLSLIHI